MANPQDGWPPPLKRALVDPLSYAVGLRNRSCVYFTEAEDAGAGWVWLKGITSTKAIHAGDAGADFPNGIFVRVSAILWCAAAPLG
jgi:hypothetical protein